MEGGIRLSVRDGRAQHLLDVDRRSAVGEREDGARLGHAAPADVIRDQASLPGRDADELRHGLHGLLLGGLDGGHYRFFTCVFWSPAWPRKCRVGANSPSL